MTGIFKINNNEIIDSSGKLTSAVFPAGTIRNAVFNSYSTPVSIVTTAYIATGLEIEITPTSTDSDIFLIFSQQYIGQDSSSGNWALQYKITRTISGTEEDVFEQHYQALFHDGGRNDNVLTFTYKDSPSLTTLLPITYKIYGRDGTYGGDFYFQNASATSTAMAFEVL